MKRPIFALLLITLLSFQISDQRSIYLIPQVSTGVTAADYDMDGDMDSIVNHLKNYPSSWQGTYILENNGYGDFIFYDSIYDTVGWYNKVGHVTGQTYPDIVSYARDSIQVLSTDGEYFWHKKYYVGGPYVYDFELCDLNNDGYTDISFSMSNSNQWGILYNLDNDGFEEPVYFELDYSPLDIDCSRINDDTIDDIIIGTAQSEVEILINYVDSFNLVKLDTYGMEIGTSDIDLDGNLDIISISELLSNTSILRIYKSNGDDTYSNMNEFYVPFCTGFSISKVNHDSLPDLILQNHSGTNPGYHIYYNLGDFQFIDTSFVHAEWIGEVRRFMECADMDGNGYDDIILSRQIYNAELEYSPLEIFFNDGYGNFVDNPQTTVFESTYTYEKPINCFPNPFRLECTIEFNGKTKDGKNIGIYNLSGQKVKEFSNNYSSNNIIWDGTDVNGKEVNPGIYIVTLEQGNENKEQIKIMKR